jgi:hypothetical protein
MKKLIFSFLFLSGISIFAQVPTNGIVAHYNFNANNGSDAMATNKATAKLNLIDFEADHFGNKGLAPSFNGSNQYVQVGSPSKFLFNTAFTISAWIKLNNVSGQQAIVSKWASVQSQDQYILMVSNGKLVMAVGNPSFSASGYTGAATLTTGVWHHVVAQWDNSGLHEIYLDGVLDMSTFDANFNSINSTSQTPLYIGCQDGVTRFFNGSIDDVRFYQLKLNTTEIQQLYNEANPISNNLVSSYYFNNNNRDTVSGNDALFTSPSFAADRFGVPNKAAYVQSNAGLLNFSDSYDGFSTPPSNGNISYAFWIKFASITGVSQMILCKSADAGCAADDRQFLFRLNANNKLELTTYGTLTLGNNLAFEATNTVLTTGTWYHVVLTYDNAITTNGGMDKYTIYVNGSFQVVSPITLSGIGVGSGFNNGNACLSVGGYLKADSNLCANAQRLDAYFDDFEIYNKTLTVIEVNNLYNSQLTGINTNDVTENEMVIYPNPFTNNLTLLTNLKSDFVVYNTMGEIILNRVAEGKTEINTQQWPAGVYFVINKLSGKSIKVIKQ